MKKIIKEIIVVEGRDDISAIKNAVDAEVISVQGFSAKKEGGLDKLEKAYENNGLIIFTDPDHAGEQIRKAINKKFPNSKNAYISQDEGKKLKDIGVENANPEAIIRALENAKVDLLENKNENIFDMNDLIDNGLVGTKFSVKLRELFGAELSIGYSNAKQLLSKLNRYNISREEFNNTIKKIMK
ncbi:MAG: ribonuclease M5 [Fusobacteriaceae bacterium]